MKLNLPLLLFIAFITCLSCKNKSPNATPIITTTALSANTITKVKKPVEIWIDKWVEGMKNFKYLREYSHETIPPEISVHKSVIDEVKDLTIENDIIRMLVNSSPGAFCRELKFKYIEPNGEFYLVFGEPEVITLAGKHATFVPPWIEDNRICDEN